MKYILQLVVLGSMMNMIACEKKVKVYVKEIRDGAVNDEQLFGTIRFVENFMESDNKEAKAQLESKADNVYNYVQNCDQCTFIFNIKEENKSHTSLLKTSQKPKAFNFNIFVDESNDILSFNALYSEMMPQDTIIVFKSGNASKPNIAAMNNNINIINNSVGSQNNNIKMNNYQPKNNISLEDDLDLNPKGLHGEPGQHGIQEPEKEQPFYKKYFWYIVIGGLLIYNLMGIDKTKLTDAYQQAQTEATARTGQQAGGARR